MVTAHVQPATSVLVATDIMREALQECMLDMYTSTNAMLEADLVPFRKVVNALLEHTIEPRSAMRLFRTAVENSNHFGGISVSIQDALQQTESWLDFVGELEQAAYESGFPEWTIWTSEKLVFCNDAHNMAGFDPFMVLSAAESLPEVVVVDLGVWFFIVRSDQVFWGERAGKEVGRMTPILGGVPLKLVDPYIHELPFVKGHNQDARPNEHAEKCFALPSLVQDSLEIELYREGGRRNSDDIRRVWEELLLEELGW